MYNTVFLLALITFLSTLLGGAIAIKLRKILPYFFAFASGSLVAVAFFDIFPESLGIAESMNIPVRNLMVVLVVSYLFYNFLERFFLTHHYHKGRSSEKAQLMGPVVAISLILHSFLDGVAIGVAYQVNAIIGIVVAFRNKHNVRNAAISLFFDALAPIVGVFSTYAITIPEVYLAYILAIFTGEFIYLGASSIMRETFEHDYWKMMLPMVLAVLLIFILTSFI